MDRGMTILDGVPRMRPKSGSAKQLFAAACALHAALALAAPDEEMGPAQAIAAGRPTLDFRPRYNRIDESDKPERTEGFTYRAVAGWRTAPWHGLRLTTEFIHTDHVGAKEFNDDATQFAASPYPLLPDPRYTGANEFFADYAGIESLRVTAGRQLVRLNNQRFVSDNDFRQVPQLFDGATLAWRGIENAQLYAASFSRVRTTSGDLEKLRLTIANAAYNPAPGHDLAAYAVFHDQAQNGAFTGFSDSSYRVVGVRAEGAFRAFSTIDLPYSAEYAHQDAYSGGDARIDVRYWRLGGGAATENWTLRYDYESKGSNQGLYGMQMPLTDFYAFNGWTLHFFNTPQLGLRDRWVTGRAQWGPLTFYGEVHRFRSDFNDVDYGRETDAGITWPALENLILRLKHARYRPGSAIPTQPSVTKTWLTITYTY